ncbi:domain-containing protein [Lichtheimia corymbifera JMRC:FSU:9682]|uniref:Domain-containing protein n=1 Tax=Lichtheimia corymbifera JMRC:FSU:9682 TaxID=1263082 RepID=A0A068SFU6_9FUNG|nr:domain-containing protein [Lichtheimia corymbifera JMRC:FSU:9682]
MNHDAEFFNESQQAMKDQYSASAIPEEPKRKATPSCSTSTQQNNDRNASPDKNEHSSFSIGRFVMSSFQLYETKTRYYLVGTNQSRQRYRVLQIHRTNPKELTVIEDEAVYTENEKTWLLKMIEDGNLAVGGLQPVPMRIYGIVGFIRFTEGWYMIFITKRKQVALLGGHYVYHIDETRLVPVGHQVKVDKNSDEARYIATFQNVDMTKNFYFSYTYDLTNSLQVNMTAPGNNNGGQSNNNNKTPFRYNDMFVWNQYLLKSGFKDINSQSGWILPLIYGFVDQAKISVFGRNVVITLIARRSRHFAGARFLKRGVNDMGYVANDVETEQIVAEMTTTSFHSTDKLFGNPKYTAYVQHRGSIPLIWTQDPTNMSPKPPIELNVVDPFYTAAALHFENLFHRYGTPCIVLNLIKQKESHKRESILGHEFEQAISYLNQFLPKDKQIKYIAWDMSRASKSPDQDVIATLETIAQETIETTGFFHSGPEPYVNVMRGDNSNHKARRPNKDGSSRQYGVLRTNCIDCLDRTNAAQFLMGKCALGHQLYALGVIASPKIDFDSDVVNIFTEMYHDHGDTIALQYGGSHLVNTMETYRKINQWTSHPRDMIETIRRFYANAFSDADKQDAINLFLGNFVSEDGQPMLWELNSDYHLHNQDPRIQPPRKDYRKWCSTDVLVENVQDANRPLTEIPPELRQNDTLQPDESDPYRGYWVEYYDPTKLTTLDTLFAYNMNGTLKYRPPSLAVATGKCDKQLSKQLAHSISPFTVRVIAPTRAATLTDATVVEKESKQESSVYREKEGWMVEKMVRRTLEPSVPEAEENEYKRYTQQFGSIDKLVAVSNATEVQQQTSFPEYQQYFDCTSMTDSNLQTQSIDEQVYKTYVDIPRRVAAVQMSREWSGNARRRYEGYASYLETGHYPQASSSHHNQHHHHHSHHHHHHHSHQPPHNKQQRQQRHQQQQQSLQSNVLNATTAAAAAMIGFASR